jgi:uncharacterized protein (DUF362 family)
MARVALEKGVVRYDNIHLALRQIASDVEKVISDAKDIVVVPNSLYPKNENTVVNADAMKAVLDFITAYTNKRITIASSSFSMSDVFSDFHYLQLQDSYNVDFIDLHSSEYRSGISKRLLSSDCRISVGLLQTHNMLLANLATSNIALAAMHLTQRTRLHDPKEFQKETALIAKLVMPHLAVIDGFSGMEENFPRENRFLEPNVAIAGVDALAVDSVAAQVMGIKPEKIGYLRKTGKTPAVQIVGEKLAKCRMKFKLPSNSKNLLRL